MEWGRKSVKDGSRFLAREVPPNHPTVNERRHEGGQTEIPFGPLGQL